MKRATDIWLNRTLKLRANVGFVCLILLILANSNRTSAQISTSVKYSEDITRQIATARQVEQQFRQYKKDSSKIVKRHFRKLKKTTDSLTSELKKQGTIEHFRSLDPEVFQWTSSQQQAMAAANQKFDQAGKYSKISKRELQSMVLANVQNRPEFEGYQSMIDRALMPYKAQIDQFKNLPQSADSLNRQIKDIDPDSAELWQQLDQLAVSEAMKTNYYEAFVKEQGQLSKLQSNPRSMFRDGAPKFDVASHPMKNARQAGLKHFDKIEEHIEAGKGEIDALKKKYAYVPDSEDLKAARKTNSLSGVPVKKRLTYGGTFHLDIGDPLHLDFNPVLGYKVNRRWTLGIGGTVRFRMSYTDSTDLDYRVPRTGARGFGEYRFFKSFLAHAEYEVLGRNVFSSERGKGPDEPAHSVNIGLGNTFGIYKGLKGKFLVLYNFTIRGDRQYTSPWVVRFGFL